MKEGEGQAQGEEQEGEVMGEEVTRGAGEEKGEG